MTNKPVDRDALIRDLQRAGRDVRYATAEMCNRAADMLAASGPERELTDAECETIAEAVGKLPGSEYIHAFNERMIRAGAAWQAARAAPAQPVALSDRLLVNDLAMMVRRLAYRLNKADPGNSLSDVAKDYLVRAGLQGSPLRTNPPARAAPARPSAQDWVNYAHAPRGTPPPDAPAAMPSVEESAYRSGMSSDAKEKK